MVRIPGREVVYDAAQLWKDECLIADGSMFGAGALWTAEHLRELDRYFIQSPDASSDSFEIKLRRQLESASAQARQLAAELLWAMMLFPSRNTIGRAAKARLVTTVWSWSGSTLDANHDLLADPFRDGVGSAGTAFMTGRWRELVFLIRWTQAVKSLAPADRSATLADPWRTAELSATILGAGQRQLRHMLLHLFFPDTFESIASGGQRHDILKAFEPELAEAGPPSSPYASDPTTRADQQLLQIRRVLETRHPGEFANFYDRPWQDRWKPEPGPDLEVTPASQPAPPTMVRETLRTPRIWVIGAGEGATRWEDFRAESRIAIGWDDLGDLTQYADRPAVQRAISARYPRGGEPTNDAMACHQFCREMAVGDQVFVKQGRARILGYGVVTGEYAYEDTRPSYRNGRAVRWHAEVDWTVPENARFPTKTLTEVTAFRALVAYIQQRIRGAAAPPVPEPEMPYTVADARSDGVFLEVDALERIVTGLRRRRNVILQGAPGVGKSFVARRLAYALIGARRRAAVQMIQFHQSYAYEDFVQGWRPTKERGFALRNGVFYEFCRRAQAHPGEPHVFIIDEINRGNLSKIFGELLLLIEADKRGPEFAIPLTYAESPVDTFHVPDNLYLLGLMNTADRSLAMVDYALRRRFAFVTLEPAFATPAFRDALREKGVGEPVITRIVDRVGDVNARIAGDTKNLGRGFEIGHSYFCPAESVADDEAWYRAVVDDEIRPLLEEYWFDDAAQVRQCLDLLAP